MYFEYFKHLTTLNTAMAIVLVALGQQMDSEPQETGAVVFVLLFLSLVPSLIGMHLSLSLANNDENVDKSVVILSPLLWLASAALVIYLAILMVVFAAFVLTWTAIFRVLAIVVLVVLFCVAAYLRVQFRRSPRVPRVK